MEQISIFDGVAPRNACINVAQTLGGKEMKKQIKCELYHDNFQNFKCYNIPRAQLVITDIPYNLGVNAYASNPSWYNGGDNSNGESKLAAKPFFNGDGLTAFLRESEAFLWML